MTTEDLLKENGVLKQALGQYKKIVESLSNFVFVFDKDFVIRDVIMSSSAQLLHTRDELLGADGRLIYSPEVSELFIENIQECLSDGKQREIEYPLESDGQVYYFQARLVPYLDNLVMAIIHDITDRVLRFKELQKAKKDSEEADKAKTVFLSNMSHEIRTPLNAIVGFAELLVGTDDSEEKAIYKEIIQKNTAQLLQLVEEVLDLSRMESGKIEMNFAEYSLVELLLEIHMVHSVKMPKDVELLIDIPDENIMVRTDRNRFVQVISNFLSNAIKNTSSGSITLKLEDLDGWAKVSVVDTGRGIPAERLATIFNRFEKVNDFLAGAGLGLSICQTIVEMMGGKIGVESEEGKGSAFSVMLRLDTDVVRQRSEGERPRILLAENDDVDVDDISEVLSADYEAIWVSNKAEALDRIFYDKPDLIVLDIAFGGGDTAVEIIEYVRKEILNIPIIVTTGQLQYSEHQKARRAGCRRILSKPYAPEQLKGIADIYLKRE